MKLFNTALFISRSNFSSVNSTSTYSSFTNRVQFLDDLAKHLQFSSWEDWYKITPTDIKRKKGGSALLKRCQNSVIEAVTLHFPQHPWKFSRFQSIPATFWESKENQKKFLQGLAEDIGVKELNDWYKVDPKLLLQNGGKHLLSLYNDLHSLLSAIYPEHNWNIWKFSHPTVSHKENSLWLHTTQRRQYFDWLGEKLGINKWEDWYNVTSKEIKENGGENLLRYFTNSSIAKAIPSAYPGTSLFTFYSNIEHPWKPWKFVHAVFPKTFWEDKEIQREFFDDIAKKLKMKELDDWYQVDKEELEKYGAKHVLSLYDSLCSALCAIYPEHSWKSWLFSKTKERSWMDPKVHRKWFDWLGEKLKINHWEDWYKLTSADIIENGGSSLLSGYYGGSLVRALSSIYPEYSWKKWKFVNVKLGEAFWEKKENQEDFMKWFAERHEITHWEDWYWISEDLIEEEGGNGLLKLYGNSIIKLVTSFYPQHEWITWKFARVPDSFWSNEQNVRRAVSYIEQRLGIKKPEEWSTVTGSLVMKVAGGIMKRHKNSIQQFLQHIYPNINWGHLFEFRSTSKHTSKAHAMLLKQILEVIPNLPGEIHTNFVHPELKYAKTNKGIELDIYIPFLSLAFEYQGQHHYKTTSRYGHAKSQQVKDAEKMKLCKSAKISLIQVPYWWDGSTYELVELIREVRPDLLQNKHIKN